MLTPAMMTPLSSRIVFVPATTGDFEELVALRIAAMRESLERVGRFDPLRARDRLRKSFYPEHTQLIVFDGEKVGFYTLRPFNEELHLDHLYVHPRCQSQGIGTCVMERLIAEAAHLRLPVRLGALRESASNRFYQRHGFVQTHEDEWDIYYIRPSGAQSSALTDEIEFHAVGLKNLDEVINLNVRPDQADLVADNLYSIAQAGMDPTGDCRAAYLGGRPVGFFYTRILDEGRLFYICRFTIDAREQGRGLGRRIMIKLLNAAFSAPMIERVDLAVSREPGGAEGFYEKCGFVATGEPYKGGWRMVLSRDRHHLRA